MYNNKDELYHYGVLGMKWGKRKKYLDSNGQLNKLGQARKAYEEAKASRKIASKGTSIFKSGLGAGFEGIQRKQKAVDAYNKSDMNVLSAKAKYAAAKAKNDKRAQKAEAKTYLKAMRKSGLPGSYADTQYGGRSTRIYNKMKAEKGKKYADTIAKRYEKQQVANIVGGVAVSVGTAVVAGLLTRRS